MASAVLVVFDVENVLYAKSLIYDRRFDTCVV